MVLHELLFDMKRHTIVLRIEIGIILSLCALRTVHVTSEPWLPCIMRLYTFEYRSSFVQHKNFA